MELWCHVCRCSLLSPIRLSGHHQSPLVQHLSDASKAQCTENVGPVDQGDTEHFKQCRIVQEGTVHGPVHGLYSRDESTVEGL